ncbi:MAG: hypothetical protein WD810_08710 [Solirubrobacterales bacterium]
MVDPGPPPYSEKPIGCTVRSRAKRASISSEIEPTKLAPIVAFTTTTESATTRVAAVAEVRSGLARSESVASRPSAGISARVGPAIRRMIGRITNGASSTMPTNITTVEPTPTIAASTPPVSVLNQ